MINHKKISVTYITVKEINDGLNMNSVCGHYIKYNGDVLISLDGNDKLSSGSFNFVKMISEMTGLKINLETSINNLVV